MWTCWKSSVRPSTDWIPRCQNPAPICLPLPVGSQHFDSSLPLLLGSAELLRHMSAVDAQKKQKTRLQIGLCAKGAGEAQTAWPLEAPGRLQQFVMLTVRQSLCVPAEGAGGLSSSRSYQLDRAKAVPLV